MGTLLSPAVPPPVSTTPGARRGFSILDLVLGIAFAALLLLYLSRRVADGGLIEIQDDEVAVVVDYWNGTERVVETPGYLSTLPYFQQVFRLRRQPETYEMKGQEPTSTQSVERLLVRAKDGSSFWFGSFTLQYALIPGSAATALQDSEVLARQLEEARLAAEAPEPEEGETAEGEPTPTTVDLARPMGAGASAVHALARSILRDEFGRFSAEEVVLPQNLTAATQESKRRLNELLEPQGIRIVQIATPKPQFDRKYEEMIERRKVANQDMERLREELSRIGDERDYRLSKVEKEMQIEREKLKGTLARKIKQAQQLDVRTRKEADVFYSEKTAEAEGLRSKKLQHAEALTTRFDEEALTLVAHAEALAENGEASVRAALIKRLGTIHFRLVPYSRDPAPGRLEVEETKTASAWRKP